MNFLICKGILNFGSIFVVQIGDLGGKRRKGLFL